nr:immunoglobulin light chain junction region [Macaca mulatta]
CATWDVSLSGGLF